MMGRDNPEKKVPWYLEPWMVILLLFLVLGPFGLPLLYKSPKFNKPWKVLLTLLMILYTGYLVIATIKITETISARFAQLQAFL